MVNRVTKDVEHALECEMDEEKVERALKDTQKVDEELRAKDHTEKADKMDAPVYSFLLQDAELAKTSLMSEVDPRV